jgi:hypothetical protein
MSQLDAPNVYLLWESRRFPLRSLTAKYFVVRSESMVRRHSPNQIPPVLNGTLVSDFGDDIPVLFRVSGTDRKTARCQLSPLSVAKLKRIEQLNSTWQAELMAAAARRAEVASEQAKHAPTVVAPLPPARPKSAPEASPLASPASTYSDSAAAGSENFSAADSSRQRSGWSRYAIALAVAAGILGLLFFRPGGDSQRRLTQTESQSDTQSADNRGVASSVNTAEPDNDKKLSSRDRTSTANNVAQSQASENTPSNRVDETGNNVATEASARNRETDTQQTDSSDLTSSDSIAQTNATVGSKNNPNQTPKPRDKSREASRSRFNERIRGQLATQNRDLAKLEALHATALKRQSDNAKDSKSSRAVKISEAKKELEAAKKQVNDSESLLEQLAPLIADENIGTAEVQEIKDELADAKRRRDAKERLVKELRQAASRSASVRPASEIDELVAKLSRKRAEIQRLERQLKRD